MAKKKWKKQGPARFEIREAVAVMNDAFNAGARTGILYFANGLRGQLTSEGQLLVDWRADITADYKGVYGAPINYNYQPYVTPKAEMYPEPDA